jgi:hypothetical protein
MQLGILIVFQVPADASGVGYEFQQVGNPEDV